MRRIVVIGAPGDKRIAGFRAGLAAFSEVSMTLLPWAELIAEPAALGRMIRPDDLLRLDSPGSDAEVYRRLAALGGDPSTRPSGHWRPGAAWFRGLSQVLHAAGRSLEAAPTRPAVTSHDFADALVMTDKLACREALAAGGIPTLPGFAAPATVSALRAMTAERRWARCFVKPRWGSSGAGVLAWERDGFGDGAREQVTVAADAAFAPDTETLTLLNSKRLRRYGAPLCEHILARILADGAVVERWLPKMTVDGGPSDLRVLCLGGAPAHRIARVGRGPITNLHLDATRMSAERFFDAAPAQTRERVEAVARAVARVFPRTLVFGLDLHIDGRGGVRVIEVNAWGDHLPGVSFEGQEVYPAEVSLLLRRAAA